MPFTVTMPKLSPTMEEGTIAKWHKNIGEKVKSGEVLVEVATDKATIEYSALDTGFLRKILIPEGSSAKVNQPIAIFTEKAEETIEGYEPEGISLIPPLPEKSSESEEDRQYDQPVAMREATAISSSLQQPVFLPEPPLTHYEFEFPTEAAISRVRASPLAKKLAKEKGIDLSTVKGSGPSGRVTSRDLNLAMPDQPVTFGRKTIPTIVPGTYETVPLSPMRKVIASRLSGSKTFIPHIYVRQEIDAGPLYEAREQLKNGNLKVTFNDFVIRAAALSLQEHPNINSGFDASTQSIILFKTVDICIAVTVEAGLITPIVRVADYKNLGEISVEVRALAARAKTGKLQPEEYKGGSFTISNMGMFGVSDFSAIINPPQSCILAVGAIEEAALVKNGAVVVGKKMGLVLSADHRVVDGAEAAQFLKKVQKYLENPALLIV
ncbi:MAG TPA: pyruvate dehydrogenase complex dihydrolipoamide acetyltransferase [Chlamydiales bacterium]|nr:pyruvate dehydrogenase complex dihydrolipoamide acetyltransferase [Chlamydiales bacterium]